MFRICVLKLDATSRRLALDLEQPLKRGVAGQKAHSILRNGELVL